MLKSILQLIEEEEQNTIHLPGTDISIKCSKDLKLLSQYSFPVMDYRVTSKRFENKFICLMAVENNTKSILSFTNFIFLDIEDFESTFFWKTYENENVLKRITLADFVPKGTHWAMTAGYSLIPKDSIPKVFSAFGKRYMDIFKKINDIGIFSYIEPMGKTNINTSMRQKNQIDLNCIDENFDMSLLGKTRSESGFSEKFAGFMGFKEQKGIYNIRTLGKVYAK